ncbi:MAG: HNH endonuclease signature motif containing protein [Oscillospiraceae bacterium]
MLTTENYVYKKEVDWSLLHEGLTLPVENQVVFGRIMGKFLPRGESKNITMYLDGRSYKAKITNVNFDPKHNRKRDTLQIRYSPNSELSNALKAYFTKSYRFISEKREIRDAVDRTMIRLPDDCKEYLAIYTTEYEDTYLLETIVADDIYALKKLVKNQPERVLEASFNYDMVDENSTIFETERIVKIRKLNKKIGDNLKLLYNYRCQICGKSIGEKYDSHIVEAHHIDYFIHSLNNDSDNQLIVCPNHHSIIHDVNPSFYRKRLIYLYPNGTQEGLVLNQHIG